ncbi:adenylate/guanylate cyclase domain-containing protein [Microvirga sp. VF16]|uniref:adenylate/guanylate cyclase domain-containing protein n=1 Tax=Microvirga sp. VF16 TaxID=2807101 RepID=UPI00193D4FDB|nr:adenylate/guanylate cyclase domain-containing protein [Microvirga sp. VF16]QRM31399.1 adenylate/guanylate cyclase domain-containing protein [Microvirga sp. VF16]
MTDPVDQKVQRRLAAVLAADVVGFSALMGQDEEGTLAHIRSLRREIFEPKIGDHQGRVVKTTGDGILVEFPSPIEAVRCAVEVQAAIADRASQGSSQALQLRIGINLGDIIIEGDGDIYGDGVNVAARLEQMAEPGGIWISNKVYEEVRDKLPYAFEDRGEQQVKNIVRPLRVYSLLAGTLDPKATISTGQDPFPPRQTVHCRAAFHQHEQRSRAGLLRGRCDGGHHHGTVPLQGTGRCRTKRLVRVPWKVGEPASHPPGAERQVPA